MFAEDNVTAQVRYRAVEHNTDGDTNECESLLRLALISDATSITVLSYIHFR